MITLTRVEQTHVYAEPLTHADPAFLLFLLFPAQSDLPTTITVAQGWSTYLGYFVLVPSTPPDATTLGSLALALQQDTAAFVTPALTSFAWTSWDGKNLEPPILLPIRTSGEGPAVSGTFPFGVGNFGIEMQDGSPMTVADAAASSFFINYEIQPGFPNRIGPGLTIPTSGPLRFCFVGQGLIGDLSDSPATGFDVALRHYVPGPNGSVTAFRYPLFAPLPDNFFLIAGLTLDPLTTWWTPSGPLQNRTRYSVTGEGVLLTPGDPWTLALATTGTALASNFRTLDGNTILLTPIDVSFVPQPLPTQPGVFYLVPQGTFSVTTASASNSPSLLCGLSGTESITIAESVLGFTAGQPAYAPAFPIVGGSGNAVAGPLLTATIPGIDIPAVTAWVSVSGTPAIYTTQPQTSPLFVAGGAQNVLTLFSPQVATLDQTTSFPMVPYAGCDDGTLAPTLEKFELQILAKARQAAMPVGTIGLLAEASAADPVTATTPQGLLVTIEGTTWTSLTLASAAAAGGTVGSLTVNITSDLQTALSSTDVFLVISNPVEPITVDGTLSVAGWPFSIALGTGTGTILIFKFCTRSLEEMVNAAPAVAWTAASRFNDPTNLTGVQATINGILSSAAAQVQVQVDPANSPFNDFVSAVTDPHWNGILALSVPLSLAALPPDLVGLAAGIDAAQFRWHHIGLNVTPVSQTLQPQASSIFGLIDYISVDTSDNAGRRSRSRSRTAAAGGGSGFSFRVLTLLAEFQNSQIILFRSTIVLTVTTLLGESVELQLPDGAEPVLKNSIVLEGHLETRVASDGTTLTVYVFSGTGVLFFLTPASAILYYIAVTQSEFNTLQPPTAANPTVLSEFRLWGTLDFQVMPGLDIFSFGDTTPPSRPSVPVGLAYSGLAIDMTFDINDAEASVTFALAPSAVTFDPSVSKPRPGSIYTGLPLSVDSLWSLAAGGSTAAWLPVNARALTSAPFDSTNWFAITNVIDLGTMGALASLASFNALLVVIWTPGGPQPSATLMMQLPGTSAGKSTLSLQDVLHVDIGQIVIPETTAGTPLQIAFHNIGLSVFGLKLPMGAALDMAIGGNGVATDSLGWYAVYIASS